MPAIRRLSAIEILDSRGRPTVQTTCVLESGATGVASVPSGASTGAAEALELRDGDPARYGGLGCRIAVEHVNQLLDDCLAHRQLSGQTELDRAMLELDGTTNKANLGANAILSVSLAFARATAHELGRPLWRHLALLVPIASIDPANLLDELPDHLRFTLELQLAGSSPQEIADRTGAELRAVDLDLLRIARFLAAHDADRAAPVRLPRPTVNLFSGGKHAGGQMPIQDILIVAHAATIDDSLAMTYAVYQAAAGLCRERYGMRALVADEGGLAPAFPSIDAALTDAVESITRAGLRPGIDVSLCVDVASSHFFQDGAYQLDGHTLSSAEMIETIAGWLERYPIVSVEDGLAEEDWQHWPSLRQRVAGRALVLGDDFLATNPGRIRRAIDGGACDALLLKVNQIGTLTEAAEACQLARDAGWAVTVSARSGETEDDWLTDLAVGWSGDQLKVGSITRSERLAKWNRLLAIESGTHLPVNPWPGEARI